MKEKRDVLFEASNTYRIAGSRKYLTLVEAMRPGGRYFRAWLADRRNADLVSDRLVVIASFLSCSFNDQKLQRLMQMTLRRELRAIELAPALATLLAVLRRNGAHGQLLDHVLQAVRTYISVHEDQILAIVEQRSRWWVPRRIDRRMAKEIADGLVAYLDDLGKRDHDARAVFDAAIERLVSDLRHDQAYRARVNAMRDRFLAAPEVNAYFETLWQGLRAAFEQQLALPNSRLRQALSGILRSIGSAINFLQDRTGIVPERAARVQAKR